MHGFAGMAPPLPKGPHSRRPCERASLLVQPTLVHFALKALPGRFRLVPPPVFCRTLRVLRWLLAALAIALIPAAGRFPRNEDGLSVLDCVLAELLMCCKGGMLGKFPPEKRAELETDPPPAEDKSDDREIIEPIVILTPALERVLAPAGCFLPSRLDTISLASCAREMAM